MVMFCADAKLTTKVISNDIDTMIAAMASNIPPSLLILSLMGYLLLIEDL